MGPSPWGRPFFIVGADYCLIAGSAGPSIAIPGLLSAEQATGISGMGANVTGSQIVTTAGAGDQRFCWNCRNSSVHHRALGKCEAGGIFID